MFPRTGWVDNMFPDVHRLVSTHVETVVLLSQRRPDEHIDIKLDLSEIDVTAAETKATYQEIKDYLLGKFGLKVSSLYISQAKAKCGLIERENYNKPKSEMQNIRSARKKKKKLLWMR